MIDALALLGGSTAELVEIEIYARGRTRLSTAFLLAAIT